MKPLFYVLLAFVVLVSCQRNEHAEKIIDEYQKNISKEMSWEYDAHYKFKYFGKNDTSEHFANCRLIRDTDDPFFGGSFWIKNDSIDTYYDLEHIYLINHRKKKITRFAPHEDKSQALIVKEGVSGGVLQSYFLDYKSLSKMLDDRKATCKVYDTTFNQAYYSCVEFSHNKAKDINRQMAFFFTPRNTLKGISFSVNLQNDGQYSYWWFSNEKYGTVQLAQLKKEFDVFAKTYTIKDCRDSDEQKEIPLVKGVKAPEFSGLYYQTGDSIKLSDYQGKIVVLDFWYQGCYPCVKAIPSLVKLRQEYSEKDLVVLGINAFDAKGERKFEDFVKKHKINYPIVFVQPKVITDYNITGYPTFYIIDRSGEIKYSKVGYSPDNEHEIKDALEKIVEN